MQTTANYGLKKPEGNDTVDIDVINGNMDSIDGELKKLSGAMGDDPNFKTTLSNAISAKANQADFNNHVNALTAHGIGDRSQLKTSSKDTIVNALNELKTTIPSVPVQSVNGKTGSVSLGASDITISDPSNHFSSNPKNVENVLAELFTSGTNGKNDIYNAISAKGTTPASKNFSDLVSAIGNIITGYGIGSTISDMNLNVIHQQGTQIWSSTNPATAYRLALDSSENVYVAYDNYLGKSVIKMNSSGAEIWSLTDLAQAYGIAVDSSGNVYVIYYHDAGSKNVRKLNSSGVEIWSKSDVALPQAIAVDSSGNVYVGCFYNDSSLKKFNSSGTLVWVLDVYTISPNINNIVVDSSGNVYVSLLKSSGTTVAKLNSNGGIIWTNSDYPMARGIAVDSSGNVYVSYDGGTSGKSVRKLNSSGVEVWSNNDVANAVGIAVDSSGNVYVSHTASSKTVRKLNPSGVEVWSNGDVTNAIGIAVSSSENVYVIHSNGVTRKIYGCNIYTIKS